MLIVDLVIVAIILLCVGLGYKRGLTGCLLKIISFILAIIVACILFKPVSILIINNTQIDENLENSIRSVIIKQEEEKNEVEKTEEKMEQEEVKEEKTEPQEQTNETKEDKMEEVTQPQTTPDFSSISFTVFILSFFLIFRRLVRNEMLLKLNIIPLRRNVIFQRSQCILLILLLLLVFVTPSISYHLQLSLMYF